MLEAKNKGVFSLVNYKVNNFSLEEPLVDEIDIILFFEPSGKYFEATSIYKLFFKFEVLYGPNNENKFLSAKMEADFKFEDPIKLNEIPQYFYANSVAIVFPYLRGFVSTITSVANLKTLVLPTLNLMYLEDELKKNTIIAT